MDNVVESREHIAINREYIRARLGNNIAEDGYDNYVRIFVEMAMKGFVSFDRDLERDDTYVWIARPDSAVAVPIEEIPTYEEGVCPSWARRGEKVHVSCLNEND